MILIESDGFEIREYAQKQLGIVTVRHTVADIQATVILVVDRTFTHLNLVFRKCFEHLRFLTFGFFVNIFEITTSPGEERPKTILRGEHPRSRRCIWTGFQGKVIVKYELVEQFDLVVLCRLWHDALLIGFQLTVHIVFSSGALHEADAQSLILIRKRFTCRGDGIG